MRSPTRNILLHKLTKLQMWTPGYSRRMTQKRYNSPIMPMKKSKRIKLRVVSVYRLMAPVCDTDYRTNGVSGKKPHGCNTVDHMSLNVCDGNFRLKCVCSHMELSKISVSARGVDGVK